LLNERGATVARLLKARIEKVGQPANALVWCSPVGSVGTCMPGRAGGRPYRIFEA
jgi:hypothetical protein